MNKTVLFLIFLLLFLACSKEEFIEPVTLQEDFGAYNPTYIQPPTIIGIPLMENPEFNKMTEEGVRLGKKLYYDNVLSTNGLSCSSCHIRTQSYSLSIMGPIGTAVLPHVNLGWHTSYGWNGGEKHLDDVALADLEEGNPFLNANNDSILERFKRDINYQQLFWESFGIKITELNVSSRQKYISYALAQFLRTMVSNNSKFDQYLKGQTLLTPSEISGYNIYMSENKGDCFHCHGSAGNPLWTDRDFHNNGLNSVFIGVDQGRYLVTGKAFDIGKFRTPTLRNIELTAPYMHDNRFSTLEEVVNFYSEGLQSSPSIDPLMHNVLQGGAQLTLSEKADLVAFLKTLTDTTFINNPAYY